MHLSCHRWQPLKISEMPKFLSIIHTWPRPSSSVVYCYRPHSGFTIVDTNWASKSLFYIKGFVSGIWNSFNREYFTYLESTGFTVHKKYTYYSSYFLTLYSGIPTTNFVLWVMGRLSNIQNFFSWQSLWCCDISMPSQLRQHQTMVPLNPELPSCN